MEIYEISEKGFEDGTNPPGLINKNVIAWKYIEELEDE